MIVTLTANTTLDQAMVIPEFKLGEVNRARITEHTVGAKPTDASWILATHGVESLALGFAAGAVGDKITRLLEEQGVDVDFVQTEGESRLGIVIIDEATNTDTPILPDTLIVKPHHIDELRKKFTAAMQTATCAVLGGSLPKNVNVSYYPEFIKIARQHNVPVVLDVKPAVMRVALKAGVDYIKPNMEEFAGLLETDLKTPQDVYEAARIVREQYGTASVISLGGDGAVAVLKDRAYRIPGIPVDVVSTVGAGDSVLAGIAWAVAAGKPMEEGLRFGIGTATAVCMNPGTAIFKLEDAKRFMAQVELIPMK